MSDQEPLPASIPVSQMEDLDVIEATGSELPIWLNKTDDEKREILHKDLPDLTLDEAIHYREAAFFPPDNEHRYFMVSARIDPKLEKALYWVSENHPGATSDFNVNLIGTKLGWFKLMKKYDNSINELLRKYSEIMENDNDDNDLLLRKARQKTSVIQKSTTKQIHIYMTLADREKFTKFAERVGLEIQALIVFSLWQAMVDPATPYLKDTVVEYGKKILTQFESHINQREYELSYKPKP
jgi:hypothetical protein